MFTCIDFYEAQGHKYESFFPQMYYAHYLLVFEFKLYFSSQIFPCATYYNSVPTSSMPADVQLQHLSINKFHHHCAQNELSANSW